MSSTNLSNEINESNEKGFIIIDKKGEPIHSNSTLESISGNQKSEITLDEIAQIQERMNSLEQKVYPHIDQMQHQVAKLNNLILILSSILVIAIGTFTINRSFLNNAQSVAGTNETNVVAPQIDTSKFDQIAITKFAGNLGINETGSKISVTQNKIISLNHTNCQTPVMPPEANGCGFVVIPNLLGLPKKGSILTTISVNGEIEGDSQILIHQKNYQKGSIEKEIFKLDKSKLSYRIPLPSDLDSSSGLYFRLWDKGGKISISSIILNFFDANNLNSVNGKLSADKSFYSKTAKIYIDLNENGIFDPQVDKQWTAKPNFPGIKPVTFDQDGNFALLRDETGLKMERLDGWKNDNFKYSLAPGKWLLVFEDTGASANFDVQLKSSQIQVDLKI